MIRKHRSRQGITSYFVYVTESGTDKKKYVGKATTKHNAQELERTSQSRQWQIKHGLRDADRSETFRELARPWVEARGEIGSDGQPRRAAWRDDVSRMYKHILPFWGDRLMAECGNVDLVKEFIRHRERAVGGTTLGNILRLLSRFFNELPRDLRKRVGNPVGQLDRVDRPRRSHDPRDTPFLENKRDILLLLEELPPVIRELYATCVLAGLRPGEARALQADDLNFQRRWLHVQRTAKDKRKPGMPPTGPLKDHESRRVPLNDDLVAILRFYLLHRSERQVSSPYLFPALRVRPGASGMVDAHTLQEQFNLVRDRLKVPAVNFYQASRHSFASHYVIDGGSIERLSKILGHSSVLVTERYAHLRSDHFTAHDLRPMLGLDTDPGRVVAIGAASSRSGGRSE